jgi:predicted nucleic acid-binding Zn ribbon protein
VSGDAVAAGRVGRENTRRTERVGDILERLCRNTAWGGRIAEGQALSLWGEVVGESLRENTHAVKIRDGKIVVVVRDSLWKQEISLLRGEIVNRLNEKIGRPLIRDVILVVR